MIYNDFLKLGTALGIILPMLSLVSTPILAVQPIQSHISNTLKKSTQSPSLSQNKNSTKIRSARSKASSERLLVKFRQNFSSAKEVVLQDTLRVRRLNKFRANNNLRLFDIVAGSSSEKVIQAIANDPRVEYVERDQQIYLRRLPDDTNYPQLWGLENTGTVGTVDVDINAEQAWDISSGNRNIVVAVIDTGVTYTHVDLKGNMWRNPNEIADNNIDDDGNGYIDDIFGIDAGDDDSDPMDNSINNHGTHIAGIMAAKGDNEKGVTGVNWNVSILACKVFTTRDNANFSGFVSSAIECLDYITDLKLKHNINIVAVNSSWGWSGAYSQALSDAIQRLGEAGILFVSAAGNSGASNDILIDYPSTYHLPNIISVAAIDPQGQHTAFSNFGARTVQISAPGQDILSTVAGSNSAAVSVNPHIDIFFDSLEQGVGSWQAQSPWGLDSQNGYNSTSAWTDSPGTPYANNTDTSLISSLLDLTSFIGSQIHLGFFAQFDLEAGFDLLQVELSGDNGKTWTRVGQLTGFTSTYTYYEFEIPASVKTSEFLFKFHLTSDATINGEGIFIDDIGIGSGPATRIDDRYGLLSGTSMAAPYVTGSLALLKSQDLSRDWVQLKNLLIAGGKPLDFPANSSIKPTVSNRSLRLVDVNGVGSMSCNNQIVKSRLRPTFDSVDLLLGSNETLNIAYLHINCDLPAGNLSVTLEETSELFTLVDDGLGFDQVAGDGIYSANIDVLSKGLNVANFHLPDGDVIRVTGKKTYIADDSISFNWRNLATMTSIIFTADDVTEFFTSPFPIMFDDNAVGFTDVGVNENGFLVLTASSGSDNFIGLTYENNRIPSGSTAIMIAPFWDDLTGISDRVAWGVNGVAPNRELIIEWNNIPRVDGTKTGIEPSLLGATFQVVLFEGSSDVLYNYQDVNFGSVVGDAAASATVGIQSSQMQGRTYSYNSAALTNQSAVLWRTTSLINFPPVITPVSDQSVIEGQSVSFVIDVSDANGVKPILTATGIPNGATVDLATGQFDWINTTVSGDYNVNFLATDSVDPSLSSQTTVRVVVNKNIAPSVTVPTLVEVMEGDDIEFQVTAKDPNGQKPILSVAELPGDAQFDAAQGLFQWANPAIGSTAVEFIATDAISSELSNSKVVTIVVTEKTETTKPDTPSGPGKRGVGSLGLLWILLLGLYTINYYRGYRRV